MINLNSMSCDGCLIPEKELQAKKTIAYNKAVKYANEIKKLVILYDDDQGLPKYMEAEAAKLAGVRVTGYIPYLPQVANG